MSQPQSTCDKARAFIEKQVQGIIPTGITAMENEAHIMLCTGCQQFRAQARSRQMDAVGEVDCNSVCERIMSGCLTNHDWDHLNRCRNCGDFFDEWDQE